MVRFSRTSDTKNMKTLYNVNTAVSGLVSWKFSDEKVDMHDHLAVSQQKCCRKDKRKGKAKKDPGVQTGKLSSSNSHPEVTQKDAESFTVPTTSALNITKPQFVLERYACDFFLSFTSVHPYYYIYTFNSSN